MKFTGSLKGEGRIARRAEAVVLRLVTLVLGTYAAVLVAQTSGIVSFV
ncbi:MAG: hypothetical protein V4441_11490 [Pseudomonadota bacterium]